jgi:hypothetical protein
MTTFRFKDLEIGESFDWIGGERPSFFARCVKISARRYREDGGREYRVGSIYADVYHIGALPSHPWADAVVGDEIDSRL